MLRNGLEPWHLLVVLAVIILLFGSKKLPEMARGLGKSMRILKAETKALREDDAPADGGGLGKSMRILKAETKALREDDAPADGGAPNATAASTASPAAEQPRPAAVSPSNVTTASENTKSATGA